MKVLTNTPPKIRNNSLDAVCGLFIIYMIIGHAFQFSGIWNDTFYQCANSILFCFMPWFFFKSGMFHKERPVAEVAQNGFHKLIVPFVLYALAGQLIEWYKLYFLEGDKDILHYLYIPLRGLLLAGSTAGNLPLWFLLSLFLTKVIITWTDNHHFNRLSVFLLALTIAGLGAISKKYTERIPYTILNTCEGMVFYISGIWMRERQYGKFTFMATTIFFIMLVVLFPSDVDFRSDTTLSGLWGVYIVGSMAGIIVFNNLFRHKFFQLPALTSIGRKSMSYYCAHWILFSLTILIMGFSANGIPDYTKFWTLVFASILILPTYDYWLGCINEMKSNKVYSAKESNNIKNEL